MNKGETMRQKEIERVFLVKKLPEDIVKAKRVMICVGDFFDSNVSDALKIKQRGTNYFLVKKDGESALDRTEHVISIKKGEFDVLWGATIQNHRKIRFFYPLGERLCEIDVYLGRLKGYIRAEVEFGSQKEARAFIAPDWFSDEITRCNHEVHEDLGKVTFGEMRRRYVRRGISLVNVPVSGLIPTEDEGGRG